MHLNRSIILRAALLISLMANLTILSTNIKADTGSCGGATTTLPFTDVQGNLFFCQIAAAYFSGLTAGTSATTFSPSQNVTREQMAAFTTRTLDQSLKRGSRRAVAKKWWMPQDANSLPLIDTGGFSSVVEFDGTDLWVGGAGFTNVFRVRPSDGKLLDSWTGASRPSGILAAMGKIFFITDGSPGGRLYMIDPTQPGGTATMLTGNLGAGPHGIAFDGSRIWTAGNGSVSIVMLNPLSVTTIPITVISVNGILYDGSHIWVTAESDVTFFLYKLNSDGSIAQTINVGQSPRSPVFDGTNIWVPNYNSNTVTVVRVKDAQGNSLANAFVLASLAGNGLVTPLTAAFDGERIMVTNFEGESVSLWKAADLTPLGSTPTGKGTHPAGACSDGLYFWAVLSGKLARF
jgi:hypothetical protein